MKMGIGIGWPNATYQSGGVPLTAKILYNDDFNIPEGGNYTIEFFAGNITSFEDKDKYVFFSFGESLTKHSAWLAKTGSDWEFLYYVNENLIISQVVTTDINSNFWNYFVIERKADYVWFGLNGTWRSSYDVGNPSPAISNKGLPMYIGSGNWSGSILNGAMNNFRWTNTNAYDTGVPFSIPTNDLAPDLETVMLIMQGYDFASSLVDQSGYGNNIIPGTSISYANIRPYTGMSGSLLFRY